MTRDVVVIGAGHNSLTAACYLARAGCDVEVVERDTVVGGAVSTVERFPGYRVDRGSSLHILIRHTGIVEDLRLTECGLCYRDCDPWGFAPFDDAALTFSVDLDRTCASIDEVCGARDADAYAAFVDTWRTRNLRLLEAFQHPPTPARVGRTLAGLSRGRSATAVAGEFLAPADTLLDRSFTDERLKTALAWLGAQAGPPPHEPGTANQVGWTTLLHERPPGRPVGGSGMLSTALAARFASYAGTLRLGDPVTAITTAGGQVTGVRTAGGEHIAARAVLAGCHIATTLELLGDRRLLEVARGLRVGNGIGMVARVGARGLPNYPADRTGTGATAAMQLLAPSRQALRTAYGEYLAGQPPARPPVVVMTHSPLDDTVAPAGRHSVTVWGQWHPYQLTGGRSWDALREDAGDRLLAAVEGVAPGFRAGIEHLVVQTPLDLERELGLRRGNVMHLEMAVDAMFGWRPHPGWSGYRGPVPRLFLCGASTHPGGTVFGASGRSAARVVLRELGRRPAQPRRNTRRSTPPPTR